VQSWLDSVLSVGAIYDHWSTLRTGEGTFLTMLELAENDAGGKLGDVLEIGTHYGVSAYCIATRAASVVTIDNSYYADEAGRLWDALGVADRITAFWNCSEPEKREIARSQRWSLAYIDGDHRAVGTWADWEAVSNHADAVLLHDYGDARPGIEGPTHVVERSGLDWTTCGAFAYINLRGINGR
jgi:hypothetical protein